MRRDIVAKRMAMAGIEMKVIAEVLRIPDDEAQTLLAPMFTQRPPLPVYAGTMTAIARSAEGRRIVAIVHEIYRKNPKTAFAVAAREVERRLDIDCSEQRVATVVRRYKIPKIYPKRKPAHMVLACPKNPQMSRNHEWRRQKKYEADHAAGIIERFRCAYCRCWGWQNNRRDDGIRPYPPAEQADLPRADWSIPKPSSPSPKAATEGPEAHHD